MDSGATVFTFLLSEVPATFVISDTALMQLAPVSVDIIQRGENFRPYALLI